jgi:copper(I)-binding protein
MRRLTSVSGIAGAMLLAALGLAGCATASAASSLTIAAAYVPVPQSGSPGTTVAYLDIRNNGHADRLLAVHTSAGGTVRLRVPVGSRAGMHIMRTVTNIPIPADSIVQLNPDNDYLLITGIGPIHDGKDITLRLTFANAGTVTVLAVVTNPQNGGSSYFLN